MKKYILSDKIAMTCVEECYIVLNLNTSIYYTLENTAYVIFNCLSNGMCTIEHIAEKIYEDYNVNVNVVKNDIESFLSQCIDHGLINVIEEGGIK